VNGPGGLGRWVVVQHVDHEPPGLVASVLRDGGASITVVRPGAGDGFPGMDELEGVVAMGGPMGVHDGDAHCWLGPERVWLAEAVDAGRVVVAICLGAQQLAMALGATVTTGEAPEIGLGPITLTEAGRRDDVFGPVGPEVPAVHWHGDTFSIPDGAVLLGGTTSYPNQIFRFGRKAFGLQCHLEVDAALADEWRPLLPPGSIDEAGRRRVETVGREIFTRMVSTAPVPAW
jgi:GMP synthase (glutamine-hydrolysing)